MRDYSNMPKLEWNDDKATIAKIKTQIMREEPVILIMPEGFKYNVDAIACNCTERAELLIECRPDVAMSTLAEHNAMPMLREIGEAAKSAGMRIDIDPEDSRLILHD